MAGFSGFSNIEKLNINKGAKKFELTGIQLDGVTPYLMLCLSGEPNKKYFNLLARKNKNCALRIQTGTMNLESIAKHRRIDREIFYAGGVLVGWGGIIDSDGNSQDFNKDTAEAFLKAVPGWLFDEIRAFCVYGINFVETFSVDTVKKKLVERLLFNIRYARDGFSVRAAIRKKRKLPSWFLNEPVMDTLDDFYLTAFWELDSTRNFKRGPIPWNFMIQYALNKGLDYYNTNDFVDIQRALDHAYLHWVFKQRKK